MPHHTPDSAPEAEHAYIQLLEAMPGNLLLLRADPPRFTIMAVTPGHLKNLGLKKEDLVGRGIFEVFPPNADNPHDTGGGNLQASFRQVLTQRQPHGLPVQRYDLKGADGRYEERYWKAANHPVPGYGGPVSYILHSTEDITVQLQAEAGAHKVATLSSEVTELVQARKKAEESEAKYRTLFESMDQGFCLIQMIFDESGSPVDYRFAEANPTFEKLTGLQDAIGKTARELVPGLEALWWERYGKVALTGEAIRFTETSDVMGRSFDVFAFRAGGPESDKVALLFTDITEKKRSELAIRESENRFRSIIDQATVAIALTRGREGVFEIVNAPMLKIIHKGATGSALAEADLLGKRITDILPELESQLTLNLVHEVLRTGVPFQGFEVPVELMVNDSSQFSYFNVSYSRIADASGAFSVLHMAVDVTEQVKARRKIEESETRFRNLVMHAPVAIAIFRGPQHIVELANEEHLRLWGRTAEEVVGRPIFDALPEARGQGYEEILAGVLSTGQPFHAEELHADLIRNGRLERVYFNFVYQALREEDGAVSGVIVVATEVTDRMDAKFRLLESEAKFRTMAESTPVLIAVADERGNAIYFNKSWIDLTGRPMEDLVHYGWVDLVHPDDKENFVQTFRKASAQKASFSGEFRVVNTDGDYRWLLAHGVQRFHTDGTFAGHISACTDITEQKKNLELLQTALDQVRMSKEAAELGTFDMDMQSGFMHWDDRCRLLFGISHRQEVSFERDFLQRLHPDDHQRVLEVLDRTFNKAVSNGDYDVEYRTIGAEDGIVRWVRAKGKMYFTPQDQPLRFIGSVLDITGQKAALQKIEGLVEERTKELAQANESLLHANRELQRSNANLEEFAHAASHDLKEPVRKIHYFTNLLKEQLHAHLSESEVRSFNRIENATQRMGHLIDDLLLYSHVSQRPQGSDPVPLNETVQRVLEDLDLDIEEKRATLEVGPLPVVKGYRRQLQQLFQNLLSNSLKYSKADEPPRITIGAAAAEREGARYHLLRVEDNGIGFEQEYAEKIFQMFARLHGRSEYSGTGVGLSIVKKVVENHNGFIEVESTVGEGSTFSIYLPV